MFINNFDPIAFNFFFFGIRWYSLSYIIGILLGWVYIKQILLKDGELQSVFDNYLSYLILGIILGGRIGYIIIYNFQYYKESPLEIFFVWQGGMSFHGGLIGIIISTYIFSKVYKKDIYKILDLVALASPIGIFLGRISNFINSELIGRPSDLPWSVVFIRIDDISRHPSQLYEAFFEGLILFAMLNIYFKSKLNKPGYVSGIFLIFYSLFRFLIEFTREPDAHIGYFLFGLTIGQIISLTTFLLGLILINLKKNEI